MLNIIIFIQTFILLDNFMKNKLIEGRYYMNHFICNMIIVYHTFSCMINSYNNTNTCDIYSLNYCRELICGLHLYHIIWYYNNLRRDDWIHHILMVGIVIPITYIASPEYHNLIGHGIFFITGLPGGIDYLLLFLVRNNMLDRIVEKRINCIINQWIRCPGCISTCSLMLYYSTTQSISHSYYELIGIYMILIIIYWNGVYFMNQVVEDYILVKSKIIINQSSSKE
jgi:hypothetical protein